MSASGIPHCSFCPRRSTCMDGIGCESFCVTTRDARSYYPPMMTDSLRHVYFGLSHQAIHCLLFRSVAANAAHSLVSDDGILSLSDFPDEVLDSSIAKNAIGCVMQHLGVRAGN